MIDRYTRQEMGRIWTLENRYQAWLDVEVAVCRAWSDMGRIPAEAVENIQAKASIDVDRILAIEEVTRHDVIAFLTSLEEKVGAEAARYIHLGCTSSDIVDTANALLLGRAGDLILRTLDFADYQPPPSQPLACRLGDWLSIRLADETTGIGQVCHISQDSQRTLLLNPERGLAIALHPAILDRQLRSGDAVIRSGQSLFENAAGRAISQTGRN